MFMPSRTDRGFTLIEMLVVIVVLGILAMITVFAVSGVTTSASTQACAEDRARLEVAVEFYFRTNNLERFPARSGDHRDKHELTLMSAGVLAQPSSYHKVNFKGEVVALPDTTCRNITGSRL